MEIERYAIYWVNLNPTVGSEINKTRPCVVVSPDELNQHLATVVIIPLTTVLKPYPWRVSCKVDSKTGMIATDQIKTIDKCRIGNYIGKLSQHEIKTLTNILKEMFID